MHALFHLGIPPTLSSDLFLNGGPLYTCRPQQDNCQTIPFGRIPISCFGIRISLYPCIPVSLCSVLRILWIPYHGVPLLLVLMLMFPLLLLYLRPHKTIRVLRSHETNPNDVVHIQFPQQVARCIELKTVVDCKDTGRRTFGKNKTRKSNGLSGWRIVQMKTRRQMVFICSTHGISIKLAPRLLLFFLCFLPLFVLVFPLLLSFFRLWEAISSMLPFSDNTNC